MKKVTYKNFYRQLFLFSKINWPISLLVLISILISFLNFEPNTFLTGWDNLHTEFDVLLNIKRSLFVTWQEYQSLGLLGGMAHASDLTHQFIFLFLKTFVPANFLRYLWHFVMLTMGPVGVYLLTQASILSNFDRRTQRYAAFIASLFYLLNIATIQNFFLPFETFVCFYGFLPWILLSTFQYIHKANRTNYITMALLMLFSGPSFYIQTFFVVLQFTFLPLTLFSSLKNKSLSRGIIALFTLVITQSYWLLPATYFSLTASSVTVNAAQNQVATPDVSLRNQEYGSLTNVALLKGFWFDYVDLTPNNNFDIVMGPWVDHFNNPTVIAIGLFFFALVMVGVFYSIKNKLPYTPVFVLSLLFSIFFLIGRNQPTGFIYNIVIDHVPLLGQFFRSAYTKWSVTAAFSYSIFIAVGVTFLLDIFSHLHFTLTYFITTFTLTLALLLYSSPTFQGYLISPSMRQSIPNEYFQLFDYFKTQDKNTRIANFPQHTFWGWEYYKWGYRGSGFLWYGIEQPILDRAFDVWSPYSESYYYDIQKAVYSQNDALFDSILEKYSVNWILIDESIIIPAQDDQKSLYIPQLYSLIEKNSKISQEATFGAIKVFKVNLNSAPHTFISTKKYTPLIQSYLDNPSTDILVDTPINNHSVLKESKNCDNFNSTLFDRQVLADEVRYKAINASSCDHLLFPYLPHNQSYTFRITHRNYSGSPFLICLEDYASKQCLVQRYLPDSDDWTTTSIEVPVMKPDEFGYTLHLFNYSIGRVPVENSWRQIEIVPAVSQVSSVKNVNPPYELATPSNIQKRNYTLYTLSANADTRNNRLVLNQAFDQRWKAFVVPQDVISQPTWLIYLDTLFMLPLPESKHLLVNDWANSWVLPQGSSHVILIYYPQYIQFIGFLMLLLLPSLYFLQPKNKKTA